MVSPLRFRPPTQNSLIRRGAHGHAAQLPRSFRHERKGEREDRECDSDYGFGGSSGGSQRRWREREGFVEEAGEGYPGEHGATQRGVAEAARAASSWRGKHYVELRHVKPDWGFHDRNWAIRRQVGRFASIAGTQPLDRFQMGMERMVRQRFLYSTTPPVACIAPTPSTPRIDIADANANNGQGEDGAGRPLIVLALESSADDSCCAIVDSNRMIRSNVVIQQHEMNAVYGGIYPLQAQWLHSANIVSGSRFRSYFFPYSLPMAGGRV